MIGCRGKGAGNGHVAQPNDTLYTQQAAMSIYGYQPARALRILDSAVIVGNLSELRAEMLRARIYSSTLMRQELDSLLGGPEDVCLDTARAIGERLLRHDSVAADLNKQQEQLEQMSKKYAAVASIHPDTDSSACRFTGRPVKNCV